MGLLVDISPLRTSRPYRRLYIGTSLAHVGSMFTTTALALQVFDLTGSSLAVGTVGIAGFIPLLVTGLWGGAIVDAFDRKTVAIWGAIGMWVAALLTMLQALLGNTEVWVLYALVALNTAAFGVESPARQAIYPRILPARDLPAANALTSLAMSTSMLVGPVLAGFMVAATGYTWTYAVNAFMTVFVLWGLAGLPAIPPLPPEETGLATGGRPSGVGGPAVAPSSVARRRRVPGLRSVAEGFRYLATRPNIRMTFFTDFCAMILANPLALLPAVAVVALRSGPEAVGILTAGTAAGALLAAMFSGRLTGVIHQGRYVVGAVAGWGVAVAAFGGVVALAEGRMLGSELALWLGFGALGFAGAFDTVSMVFRNTIMQASADDSMRGRLQGIFIVVVAGGPRLGQFLMGALAAMTTEWMAAVIGGFACVAAVLVLARAQPGFLAYDSRTPNAVAPPRRPPSPPNSHTSTGRPPPPPRDVLGIPHTCAVISRGHL
ncbi:MAG: MFS transporter [bacterium]|nr:MFS transporter [bacterium]